MSNPFHDIHTALWTMLEAHTLDDASGFADLVPSRNRLKYVVTSRDAVKLAEGGFPDASPRVAIVQRGMKPADRIASNLTQCQLIWQVVVATGDERFTSFFAVQFAVMRALLRWDDYLAETLTWESEPYVGNMDFVDTTDDRHFEKLNAIVNLSEGVAGWSSVWTGVVDCNFNHATLIGT